MVIVSGVKDSSLAIDGSSGVPSSSVGKPRYASFNEAAIFRLLTEVLGSASVPFDTTLFLNSLTDGAGEGAVLALGSPAAGRRA